MTAHVVGLPLEELLSSLTGSGAAVLVARAWVSSRRRSAVVRKDPARG